MIVVVSTLGLLLGFGVGHGRLLLCPFDEIEVLRVVEKESLVEEGALKDYEPLQACRLALVGPSSGDTVIGRPEVRSGTPVSGYGVRDFVPGVRTTLCGTSTVPGMSSV